MTSIVNPLKFVVDIINIVHPNVGYFSYWSNVHAQVSYLILADWVLFQQVLVTATNLEDVFTLIFLNTHLELLWGQQHAACFLTNGLCNHL